MYTFSDYPDNVTLSSEGPLLREWYDDTGVYMKMKNITKNGRPVWKHNHDVDPKYLFYDGKVKISLL